MKAKFEGMLAGLSQIDHKLYEPALTQLGLFLGAYAFKPQGNSRTDAAWCWDETQWVSVEAKSEHKIDGIIGVTDTIQVNAHLALISEDRGAPVPAISAAVMVSPRTLVHKDAIAVASADSYRVTPNELHALATEVERMWTGLQVLVRIKTPSERVEGVIKLMEQHRLRPEDIFDRLTLVRIGEV